LPTIKIDSGASERLRDIKYEIRKNEIHINTSKKIFSEFLEKTVDILGNVW
jgi:hypothetical protein